MTQVEMRLIERDEQPFPGLAHLTMQLADGRTVDVWDKMPVLGVETTAQVGDSILVDCEVLADGPRHVVIHLQHHVQSVDDEDTFTVDRKLLS